MVYFCKQLRPKNGWIKQLKCMTTYIELTWLNKLNEISYYHGIQQLKRFTHMKIQDH